MNPMKDLSRALTTVVGRGSRSLLPGVAILATASMATAQTAPPVVYVVRSNVQKWNNIVQVQNLNATATQSGLTSSSEAGTFNNYFAGSQLQLWANLLDVSTVVEQDYFGTESGRFEGIANLEIDVYIRGAAGTPFSVASVGGQLSGQDSGGPLVQRNVRFGVNWNSAPGSFTTFGATPQSNSFNIPPLSFFTGSQTFVYSPFPSTTYTKAGTLHTTASGYKFSSQGHDIIQSAQWRGTIIGQINAGTAPTGSLLGPEVGGNYPSEVSQFSDVNFYAAYTDTDGGSIWQVRHVVTKPNGQTLTLDGTNITFNVDIAGQWRVDTTVVDDEGALATASKNFFVDTRQIGTSVTNLNFGTRPLDTSATQTFQIQNFGSTPLNLSVGTPSASAFQVLSVNGQTPGPTSIPAGGSIPVVVRYTASNFATESATLDISSSDPNNPVWTVNLQGRPRSVVQFWIKGFLPGNASGTMAALAPFPGTMFPVSPLNPSQWPLQYGIRTDNRTFSSNVNDKFQFRTTYRVVLEGRTATVVGRKNTFGLFQLIDNRGLLVVNRANKGTFSLGGWVDNGSSRTATVSTVVNYPLEDYPTLANDLNSSATYDLVWDYTARSFGISGSANGNLAIEAYVSINGSALEPLVTNPSGTGGFFGSAATPFSAARLF